MKKAKKSIGIVLIAILLILCLAVDALGVRYSTVVTRFWSGTYGTVQTETDDTQLKATDAAAELTETIAEEGIVLMKNNGLLPMAPSKENRNIALLGYASYSPMYIGAGSVSQAGSYVSNEFIDFYSAFETAGYTVNKDMKAYYAQYGNSNGATGDMSGSGWSQATGVDDGPLYGDSEASVAYTDVYHDSKGLFFQDPHRLDPLPADGERRGPGGCGGSGSGLSGESDPPGTGVSFFYRKGHPDLRGLRLRRYRPGAARAAGKHRPDGSALSPALFRHGRRHRRRQPWRLSLPGRRLL